MSTQNRLTDRQYALLWEAAEDFTLVSGARLTSAQSLVKRGLGRLSGLELGTVDNPRGGSRRFTLTPEGKQVVKEWHNE